MLRPLTSAFALLLLALAAGCGRTDQPPAAPGSAPTTAAAASAKSGPMIWRVGNGTEPQDLDPHIVTGVPEHKILMALFEGLLSENPKDLSPEPGIAERWEISPDGLTYTFHLRAGAQWSDGVPITATTTCPLRGGMARSTSSTSPSKMPASFMESPRARMRKVAWGCLIRRAARSMRLAPRSSAGEGKPARTLLARSKTGMA